MPNSLSDNKAGDSCFNSTDIFRDICLHSQLLEDCVGKIRAKELIQIAQAFASSADTLLGMSAIPLVFTRAAVTEILSTTTALEFERASASFLEDTEIKEKSEKIRSNVVNDKRTAEIAKIIALSTLRHPQLQPAATNLLYALIVFGWTAFETLSLDLWITAANANPRILQNSALFSEAMDDLPEGISKKGISIGLLAKNGFDLRDKMGTLLAPKFDFTSVDGIRKAYKIFSIPSDIKNKFDGRELHHLEAYRHVIVHRGGLIDQKFLDRTSLELPLGSKLELDGGKISKLVNASLETGCLILKFMDDWFDAPNRSIKTPN